MPIFEKQNLFLIPSFKLWRIDLRRQAKPSSIEFRGEKSVKEQVTLPELGQII